MLCGSSGSARLWPLLATYMIAHPILIAEAQSSGHTQGESCPVGCACSSDGTRADCLSLRLRSIPKLSSTLEYLNLSGSTFPENSTFSRYTSLYSLDLSSSGIKRLSEAALLDLPSLRTLVLAGNRIDADSLTLETFRPVRRLEVLDLRANPGLLSGGTGSGRNPAAAALRLLGELRSLNLASTNLLSILDTLGSVLPILERLETLVLSNNDMRPAELSREAARLLGAHGSLRTLALANCGLARIEAGAMESLNTVVDLDLSGNRISATDLKQAFDRVQPSFALQRLNLARMGISSLDVGADELLLSGLRAAARLTFLDLSGNNLVRLGRRPFNSFANLERIDLSNNKIELLDPMNFAGLTSLKHLSIARNRIAHLGSFDFENMAQLQWLDLSGNLLSNLSSSALASPFEIKHLDLSDNVISSLGRVAVLELVTHLNLSGNRLTSLGMLHSYPNIQVLDASRNRIQTLPAAATWPSSSSLVTLDLSSNDITEVDSLAFSRHSPQVIDLSHNMIERIRDFGWKSSTLRLLLRGNKVRHVSAGAFRSVPDLVELDLGGNALEELDASVLASLGRLRVLRLDSNRLGVNLGAKSGPAPFVVPSVGHAATAGSIVESPIEDLDLSRNGVEALREGLFRNLTRLRHLSLSGNRLSSFTSAHAAGLEVALESLDISSNNLSRAPHGLLSLKGLSVLDMSQNPLDCGGCSRYRDSVDSDAAPAWPSLKSYFGAQKYVCATPQESQGMELHELVPGPVFLDGCSASAGDSYSLDNAEEKKIILIVIGCTAFVILVIAGIIFWHHRWRLRKKQQKQHCKAAYKQAADRCAQQQPPLPCEPFLPPIPPSLPPSLMRPPGHSSECGTYHRGLPAYV